MLQEKLDELAGMVGTSRGKQDCALMYLGAAALLNDQLTEGMVKALTDCAIQYLTEAAHMLNGVANQLRLAQQPPRKERTQ